MFVFVEYIIKVYGYGGVFFKLNIRSVIVKSFS